MVYLSNVIKLGIPKQCVRIGYSSAMYWNWELFSHVIRLGIPQQCVRIGYSAAMYWNWELLCHVIYRVYLYNVIKQGVLQQSNKIA